MADFDEFDEFEDGFSIQDMMEDTGLTRNGVYTWLRRNGHKPFRVEGGKGFYEAHVLNELMTRKKYKTPPKSKTSVTPKKSMESEEHIAYLEDKCKKFEVRMTRLEGLFEDLKRP